MLLPAMLEDGRLFLAWLVPLHIETFSEENSEKTGGCM